MYIVRGSISSISSVVSNESIQGKKLAAQVLELLYENDQLFVLLY